MTEEYNGPGVAFGDKRVKGVARGNSPSSTAPPSIGHGPQSQRSPSAWKTKEGSGPSAEGGVATRVSSGTRERSPAPFSAPVPEKGGAPRPPPEWSPRGAGNGSQAVAHAQARAATGRPGGGGARQGGGAGGRRKALRPGGAGLVPRGRGRGAGRSRPVRGCLRQSLP